MIVDRGTEYEENLEQIQKRGWHYLVAGRQAERNPWLEELENDEGWEKVLRTRSPRNALQKKTRVQIKRQPKGEVVYLLCRSEGREEKDRAIRETQEAKLRVDLTKLQQRVAQGRLKKEDKIQQSIGRLRERYPRVARYYQIVYDSEQRLSWKELSDKKALAQKLDGSYVLKTDRQDLTADEIWCTYSADASGRGLPRHEESADGAAHFSSSEKPNADPYLSSAKAALESHVRQLAMELARRGSGISVNSIRAGVTVTPALMMIPEPQKIIDAAHSRSPAGRMTTPQDVANVIVALSGDGTEFSNGEIIGVDGGEFITGS